MTANILFAAKPDRWTIYEAPLRRALDAAGVTYDLRTGFAPEEVDYIVYAPNSDVQDFTPYTRLKAVLNLWAGVENITGNQTLTVPLARMVDHGLTQGMVEWVTGHALRHHLGMDADILGQDGTWRKHIPPLASERGVTVLGLGELGRACAETLASLGFDVTGWARSPKDIPGIRCLHGDSALADAMARAEILVLLLPDTPATENTLNARTLAQLPRGACIINPGRGPLIDDDALLAALDAGQVGHATLDVFRTEPLPADHPYWAHPNVTVTPHIASETRPETASQVIAENVRRGEAGEPFLHLVNRDLGY
ncbi:2-hydroxyacid dehydrogenase [Lutimaribacter marinistellae]|uniref:2-hydroxyacid dehydrogenase n=1 Tax=Lutimaribacter marinistellae TaxID=1820329 RepID=A0ABV7TAQ4_9RHOB